MKSTMLTYLLPSWDKNHEQDSPRSRELFDESQQRLIVHTDRMFGYLMSLQWLLGIVAALIISPLTWIGSESKIHLHVWAAVGLGFAITSLPVLLAFTQPGRPWTRYSIAIGQMLMSALLIHLTGGRIETHFHVFGSLAILAFYRDIRILLVASAVIGLDHMIRGIYWPASVFGVLTSSPWRWIEHVLWVGYEVTFLCISVRVSLQEMTKLAQRQANLESMNDEIERRVEERTRELQREIEEHQRTGDELRMTEKKLRGAQRMEVIGNLAGGIAHDFNNLLMVINGYSGLLLKRGVEPVSANESIKQINMAGEKAALMTRQLLAFSRKQVMEPSLLDLNELLAEINRLLARLVGENIDIKLNLAEDLWPLMADPSQLDQVIMNLVVNARDAMPEGGLLTIETANVELDEMYTSRHPYVTEGQYVRLSISDSGCGMDSNTVERIFEPFFTTKGADKGTGLGMATVYGIVKQSGGSIEVYSEPGIGTNIQVFLPRTLSQTAVDSNLHHEPVEPDMGTETVLLVEDSEAVRTITSRILTDGGYRILEACNAGEALNIFKADPDSIDLILTDVIMPGINGPQMVQQIKQMAPDVPVIYMSGYTGDAISRQGLLDEGSSLLQKPFNQTTLLRRMREMLDAESTGNMPREQSPVA